MFLLEVSSPRRKFHFSFSSLKRDIFQFFSSIFRSQTKSGCRRTMRPVSILARFSCTSTTPRKKNVRIDHTRNCIQKRNRSTMHCPLQHRDPSMCLHVTIGTGSCTTSTTNTTTTDFTYRGVGEEEGRGELLWGELLWGELLWRRTR